MQESLIEYRVDLKLMREHQERWKAWRETLTPDEQIALDAEQHEVMFRAMWKGACLRPWTSPKTGLTKVMDSVNAYNALLYQWQQMRLAQAGNVEKS